MAELTITLTVDDGKWSLNITDHNGNQHIVPSHDGWDGRERATVEALAALDRTLGDSNPGPCELWWTDVWNDHLANMPELPKPRRLRAVS